MTRGSLDTSRLSQDVLTYKNQDFFDFIASFCGKDEADLLAIQGIRSVDTFLCLEDFYSIFVLDSDDVKDIQIKCGFRNRNGTYSVKPGIKDSLYYIGSLLKEMKKKVGKMKKLQPVAIPLTDSATSVPTTIETKHREYIQTSIDEWFINNKNDINIHTSSFTYGVNYHLIFSSSMNKAEIECSCGASYSLVLSSSENFKVSNYFRHLKTSCTIIRNKAMNNSINNEGTDNDIQSSSSSLPPQQPSGSSVRKRFRRTTATNHATTKRTRTI